MRALKLNKVHKISYIILLILESSTKHFQYRVHLYASCHLQVSVLALKADAQQTTLAVLCQAMTSSTAVLAATPVKKAYVKRSWQKFLPQCSLNLPRPVL